MSSKSLCGRFYFDGSSIGLCIVGTEHNHNILHSFDENLFHDVKLQQSHIFSDYEQNSILVGYSDQRCALIVHLGECFGAECGCVDCARHILRSDQPPENLETYVQENGPKLKDRLDFPYLLVIVQGNKAVQIYCNDGVDFGLEFVYPGTYSIENCTLITVADGSSTDQEEPNAAVQLRDAVRSAASINREGDQDLALAIDRMAACLFREAQGPYRRTEQEISEQVLTLIDPGGGRQATLRTTPYSV